MLKRVTGNPFPATVGSSLKEFPFSMGHAIMRMQNGGFAMFESVLTEAPISHQPWFDIQCERGEIVIDSSFEGGYGVKVFSTAHPQGVLASLGPQGWTPAYRSEVADFIDRCFPIVMPDVSNAELALTDLQTVLAMKASVESCDWVRVASHHESIPAAAFPASRSSSNTYPDSVVSASSGNVAPADRAKVEWEMRQAQVGSMPDRNAPPIYGMP